LSDRRARERRIFLNADYTGKEAVVFATDGGDRRVLERDAFFAMCRRMTADIEPSSEEELPTEVLIKNPSSKLLPQLRPRETSSVVRAALRNALMLVPSARRNDPFFVLGVRDYYLNTMGKAGVGDRNLYDDAIFVVTRDNVVPFNANTDPSTFRSGIAQLKVGQAVCYKPGLHGISRGAGYPAFRQNSPVVVVRDGRGEDSDAGKAGFFWINLHRGGNTTTSSEGCQTVPPNQWDEFRDLVNILLKEHQLTDFYYILIDNDDLIAAKDTPANETNALATSRFAVKSLADLNAALSFMGGEVGHDNGAISPTTARSLRKFLDIVNLPGIERKPELLFPVVQAVYLALGGK
jgi:lysozyme